MFILDDACYSDYTIDDYEIADYIEDDEATLTIDMGSGIVRVKTDDKRNAYIVSNVLCRSNMYGNVQSVFINEMDKNRFEYENGELTVKKKRDYSPIRYFFLL